MAAVCLAIAWSCSGVVRSSDGIRLDRADAVEQSPFVDGVEERAHRVIILHGERIVFVIVAARALEGQREESGAEGVDPVGNPFLPELRLDAAAFLGLAVQAVEGGGGDLFAGRIWQQVAGDLPGDELVPRQVFVERVDDPVAVGPCVGIDVGLIAERVRVTRDIEPADRHFLAVAG